MKAQDLVLLTDLIRTDSFYMGWYSNDLMRWRHGMKDGVWHGDSKLWRMDGSLLYNEVWENGRLIKTIV